MRNRESTDEIIKLEAELKRAYWRKELVGQLTAKQVEKNMEKTKAHLESEKNRLLALIELEDEDRRRAQKRDKVREDMAREISERTAREAEERVRLMEEGLRERKYLEEVERRLEEYENTKKLEKKLELARIRVEDRQIISDLMEIQLAFKKKEEESAERDKQIYFQEIEQRNKDERNRRAKIEERRERVLTSLLATIIQEDASEREKKRLLQELIFEELELERAIKDWKEMDIQSKMAKALMGSLKQQIILTELCKADFLRRDQEFAKEMSKRLAENDKIVRLTADAKKRALLRYRQDLDRMIVERQMIVDEEICKVEKETEEERILKATREEIIKKEREILLLEHASNVGEFLNKNYLTEDEQNILQRISFSSKDENTNEEDDSL
ncbi:PREDICTED: caldesmon-like [Polistes canadensis]|uniref:caldesmon-like n=1 Tax=Polistes canadensis TaxID=91411 RepID=UPI000719057F|nr:PREDICTED: caldesmon-like [Polistes canadensis]